MLKVESAASTPRHEGRIAVALAGGGPLGAFYELGSLHALAECTTGLELTHLDGYVGVSSGSIIASLLANGISTTDMIRMFFIEDDAQSHPLTPGVLMHPAVNEYLARAAAVPRLLNRVLQRLARDPLRQNWAAVLSPLLHAIPNGLFDSGPFEKYLRVILSATGRTNDFRRLDTLLRIVATDLNSGGEVRFGEPGMDHIPISQAIQASTALPGLYTPVHLEGHTYVDGALLRTVHASLVLDHGMGLVISVNPLVTFDAAAHGTHSKAQDLAADGLITVLSQTFRALIQSRMQIGMAAYRERYPHSDRLLFEPDRDDGTMFFVNVFRYKERRRLAEHAYQRTRSDLLAQASCLEPILARHGVSLQHERLTDANRTFDTAARGRQHTPIGSALSGTLDELADWMHR